MKAAVLCLLLIVSASRLAWGAPGWEQRLGARLPLEETFRDEQGRTRQLASYFGGGPVLLMFGYYRCPNLCDAALPALLSAAASAGLPRDRYRVLVISIDPRETPAVASEKRNSYLARSGLAGLRFDLLTGPPGAIARATSAAGFNYALDARRGYIHPSGLVVATPDGTISRYFLDTQPVQTDLRLALVDASGGRIGSLSDRIALLCSHFDPATGRYTSAVMSVLRAIGALSLLALAAGLALLRKRTRSTR